MPIALKDIVDTAGLRTTAPGFVQGPHSCQDAEVVSPSQKPPGAVFLSKLNYRSSPYGGSSVIQLFGPVRNPWDPIYSAGGSSGICGCRCGRGFVMPQLARYGRFYTAAGELLRHCWIETNLRTGQRFRVIPLSWSLIMSVDDAHDQGRPL